MQTHVRDVLHVHGARGILYRKNIIMMVVILFQKCKFGRNSLLNIGVLRGRAKGALPPPPKIG